ncbi:MAG: hypothetical protein ABWJ97_04460 [Thermoproteus sp.]
MMAITITKWDKVASKKPASLLRFWYGLEGSYRAVINTRMKKTLGVSFEEYAVKNPEGIYEALRKAIGEHNAGVFMIMYTKWLESRQQYKP